MGTWLAETVAALNDEFQLNITLELFARGTTDWVKKYPHLSLRKDISVRTLDVRSQFDFTQNTRYIVHAAGIPNSRAHASDPLRVQQTAIQGIDNALRAASALNNLVRFVNVSSCFANGTPLKPGPLHENDYYPVPCDALHAVYPISKRAAENLAVIYRSQFRMPISTVRPFTFSGPYQALDSPWALNNFLRDALTGSDIRIHGNGSAQRSYLYGSDAAAWILSALTEGTDGAVYNIGSSEAISHMELARKVSDLPGVTSKVLCNTRPQQQRLMDDLYPDLSNSCESLGAVISCALDKTIEKSWRWHANSQYT